MSTEPLTKQPYRENGKLLLRVRLGIDSASIAHAAKKQSITKQPYRENVITQSRAALGIDSASIAPRYAL